MTSMIRWRLYSAIGLAAVAGSFVSFDVALVPMMLLPALPVLFLLSVGLALASLRRGATETTRRRARTMGAALVLCTVVCVGCFAGYHSMRRAVETQAQPVVDALEAHRTETGAYPRQLAELVPGRLPKLPWRFEGGVRSALGGRIDYNSSGGGSFRLTIATFYMQRLSYEPGMGWYTWD